MSLLRKAVQYVAVFFLGFYIGAGGCDPDRTTSFRSSRQRGDSPLEHRVKSITFKEYISDHDEKRLPYRW